MARRDQGDERGGISIETLVVASLASVTAMIVVSHFWRPGTVISAAATPVIVTLASEMLRRPAKQLTRMKAPVSRAARVRPTERRAPGRLERAAGGESGPLRVYGSRRNKRLKVALVTGVVAFAIGAFVLTVPELIFGNSVTRSGRTTLFGGGHRASARSESPTQTQETTTAPQETQPPGETTTAPAPTATTPTTPPAQTPNGGQQTPAPQVVPPPAQTAPVP